MIHLQFEQILVLCILPCANDRAYMRNRVLEKSFTTCEKSSMDEKQQKEEQKSAPPAPREHPGTDDRPAEIGGPKGPEPTRYGDWERRGRCIDF